MATRPRASPADRPGTGTAGAGRTPRRSGTRRPPGRRRRSPMSPSRARGHQLVARVVEQATPVVTADPAPDLERAAGVDPRDLPTAQPEQRHPARPVTQLDLQRGVAAMGVDGDGGDGTGELDQLPVLTRPDRYGTLFANSALQVL